MPKRTYTREQMDKANAKRREQRKNETPKQKQKRYKGQLDWNKRNPDKLSKYTEKTKDKRKEISKKWAKENRERHLKNHREYVAKKRKNDPIFKFKSNVRTLIGASFRDNKFNKTSRTEEILGCSLEFLRIYILSKCPEGVTLKDFGAKGYHIDHIIPISIAKTEEEIIRLCHYTNLQPLWWRDNIVKRDKILP